MSILTLPKTHHFAREYAAWADSFTDAPPQYHRAIGYWIVSTLLGRSVWLPLGDDNLYPNLWLLVLGPSSYFRKSTAMAQGLKIVNAVRPGLILPSEWTGESLIAQMVDSPHGAMAHYEFRTMLGMLAKDYNSGATSLLTELYDCPQKYTRKTGVKEIKEFNIEAPYLTILGASTVEWLIESVKGGDVAGGFMARFLFVSATEKKKVYAFQPEANQAEKQRLINMATELSAINGPMGYTLDAKREYESWYRDFFERTADAPEAVRAFFPRLAAYCHKFAMLESVMAGRTTITLADCKAACRLVEGYAAEVTELGGQSLGKSKFDVLKLRILNSIKRDPGIGHSRLLKNSGLSAKVFKDVVGTLKETNEIVDRKDDAAATCYYPADDA